MGPRCLRDAMHPALEQRFDVASGWEAIVFTKSIYEEAFGCDGSHRDLYVRSTSLDDWNDLLKLIDSPRYRRSFQIDGIPARIPSDVSTLFSTDTQPLLQIDLGGVTLNCHFFIEAEIELDLDPQEIAYDHDGARADAILALMAEIGAALRKPVLMTAENAPDAVIFRYDSSAETITYESPSEAASPIIVRLPKS
jgi:hypothetical protein